MSFDMSDYVDVGQRMADLFAKYPDARLQGNWQIIEVGQQRFVVYRAECFRDMDDEVPGVGTAMEEIPGRTPYTKGSEIQNAETSAWGRAIVAIGASTSKRIASAEDVRNARAREDAADPMPISSAQVEDLKARCIVLKNFGVNLTDHRHRWRLPILDASDNADLAQWEAMLKQLEDNLDAVTKRGPTNQANDEAAINSGKLDGPPAPDEPTEGVTNEPDIGGVETEEELRARIEAEVAALKPVEVRQELEAGHLELNGNPKMLRERLVAYRIWCALGQEELPPADPSPQEVLVAEEML